MTEAVSPEQNRSTRHLLRELVNEVTELVRSEMRLARAETSENVGRVGGAVMRIAAGALLGFAALIVLLQALVIALSNIVEPWIASLIVGVVVAAIGYGLVRSGQSDLKPQSLAPTRSFEAVKNNPPAGSRNREEERR
jgi:xanthine/uracil permease